MTGIRKNTTRLVVGGYVALTVGPLLYAAPHSWFWQHAHNMAPVAPACLLALLVALLYKRRWAWFLLALFEAVAVDVSPCARLASRQWRSDRQE